MEQTSVIETIVRRWVLVVGLGIAAAAVAVAIGSIQPETHEVETRFAVREELFELSGLERGPLGVAVTPTDWRTLSAPLRSRDVVESAAAEAGVEIDDVGEFVDEAVTLVPEDSTHSMTLTMRIEGDPGAAEDMARAMITTLDASVGERFEQVLDARIEAVAAQLDSAWDRVRILPQEQGAAPGTPGEPVSGGEAAYDTLSQQLGELRVARAMEVPFVIVIEEPSAEQVAPDPIRDLAVGLAVGVLAGVGVALVLDSRDRKRRSA